MYNICMKKHIHLNTLYKSIINVWWCSGVMCTSKTGPLAWGDTCHVGTHSAGPSGVLSSQVSLYSHSPVLELSFSWPSHCSWPIISISWCWSIFSILWCWLTFSTFWSDHYSHYPVVELSFPSYCSWPIMSIPWFWPIISTQCGLTHYPHSTVAGLSFPSHCSWLIIPIPWRWPIISIPWWWPIIPIPLVSSHCSRHFIPISM